MHCGMYLWHWCHTCGTNATSTLLPQVWSDRMTESPTRWLQHGCMPIGVTWCDRDESSSQGPKCIMRLLGNMLHLDVQE